VELGLTVGLHGLPKLRHHHLLPDAEHHITALFDAALLSKVDANHPNGTFFRLKSAATPGKSCTRAVAFHDLFANAREGNH